MITVITTTYNAAEFIGQAIQSILEQDFSDFEYIIVDDGSTDRSMEVVEKFKDPRLRFVRPGRIGRARALNLGLQMSKGEYVAVQDADDISHPKRLSTEFDFLCNEEDSLIGTGEIILRGNGTIDWQASNSNLKSGYAFTDVTGSLVYYNPVSHTSVMVRKGDLIKVGGYNTNRKNLFDWDLYLRLASNGYRILKLSVPLVAKRFHEKQFFENRKRAFYVYSSLRLQIQASFSLRKKTLPLISLPILFAYRLLPEVIRIAVRKRLKLTLDQK